MRAISCILVLSLSLPIGASASTITPAESNPTYTETIVDDVGNSFQLIYSSESTESTSNSHAALYNSSGDLVQETYTYPSENRVVEYIYSTPNTRNSTSDTGTTSVKEYVYSDLICEVPDIETSTDKNTQINEEDVPQYYAKVPFPVFNSEDWAHIDHWPAASASPYAIDLYSMNYDQEPDSHRFAKTNVDLPAKTALTTVVGLLGNFIRTGGITISAVVRSFGAAIVTVAGKQIINKPMDGSTCYSTQKILYAPVIEGYNIYPGAYITKLWLVTMNAVTQTSSVTIAQRGYKYSHQPSPDDLMYAARHYFTDWARANGYHK